MEKRLSVVLLYLVLSIAHVACNRDTENIKKNIREIFESLQCVNGQECVKRNLCDESGKVITDGKGLITLRNRYNNQCRSDETCCSVNNTKLSPDNRAEEQPRDACGQSNPNGLEQTMTNLQDEAKFGEFPWMVQVWQNMCISSKCEYRMVGGGSLLTLNVALTTAHQIANSMAKDLTVRAGEWDMLSVREPYEHIDKKVRQVKIHENFEASTGYYDIALLKLKTPFMTAPYVGTICLPDAPQFIDQENCFVMGWGKKSERNQANSNILKKIGLSVVDSMKCERLLRYTQLGNYFELHNSFICAGGEQDKDACHGDGGSPLVCPVRGSSDRFQLVGLVSWGLACGTENVPGIYTNVRILRPWIEQNL